MFKPKDRIVFKYPDLDDAVGDAHYAVNEGKLTLNKTYVVYGRAMAADTIQVINDCGSVWNIDYHCFERAGPQRNLPEWF